MPVDILNTGERLTCIGTAVGDFNVSAIVVVCVKLPDTPVMVIVEVPVAVVLLVERVNVLVPLVLAGLNDAVTPLGTPDVDKLTLPLKPFSGLTVIVLLPPALWVTLRLVGEAESK